MFHVRVSNTFPALLYGVLHSPLLASLAVVCVELADLSLDLPETKGAQNCPFLPDAPVFFYLA
jgi:hypothetical protein